MFTVHDIMMMVMIVVGDVANAMSVSFHAIQIQHQKNGIKKAFCEHPVVVV